MRFHKTQHSLQRSEQRGLSVETLKNVVTYPDRKNEQYTGKHGGKVWKFWKTVDGKTLVAVAEIYRQDCWILTGWKEGQ